MNIKNIFHIAVVAFAALLTTSCSDWLDYTPKDKSTEDQQFSTRQGFYTAVNGVYNKLASSNLYGSALSYGAIDLMSQRYEPGSNSYANKYRWTNFRFTESDIQSSINAIWQESYQTILNTNVILDGVEKQKSVLSESDKEMIKGDLLGLRAFIRVTCKSVWIA